MQKYGYSAVASGLVTCFCVGIQVIEVVDVDGTLDRIEFDTIFGGMHGRYAKGIEAPLQAA